MSSNAASIRDGRTAEFRDRVTKRFYAGFKSARVAFLESIRGIPDQGDREWYASLMIFRLVFVWFVQRKGFLDGRPDYLRDRLQRLQDVEKNRESHTYYRRFLLPLFNGGFAGPECDRQLGGKLSGLLGRILHLPGGLFSAHALERRYPQIEIPDEAFGKLFDFFDRYTWQLDGCRGPSDREIDPGVLGHILEQYVNQQQMGAYYTRDDITEYISRNTIIPWLFAAVKGTCPIAFDPDSPLWSLLRRHPDRYLYAALRHGVIDEAGEVVPLPAELAPGVGDIAHCDGWNKPAPAPLAHPVETRREHVARRQRCLTLRGELAAGRIGEVNDLVTHNLDIRRFAEDVIAGCEDPQLLRAFWTALLDLTVLDPTCGSGAFLIAAMDILQPLYRACLERMQALVEESENAAERHPREELSDFRDLLADAARDPGRDFFIARSIVVSNLYGVDLMDEAVEICQLRLLLRLVSHVDRAEQLESLAGIEFNIRSGNALVGFTRLEAVQTPLAGTEGAGHARSRRILDAAERMVRSHRAFRELSLRAGADRLALSAARQELQQGRRTLVDRLDRVLAGEFGVQAEAEPNRYRDWQSSHRPLHWSAEFPGAMSRGGFSVVIGNPPYLPAAAVRRRYAVRGLASAACPDIYAWCLERAADVCGPGGRLGMILPLSLAFSADFFPVRKLLWERFPVNWFSSFGRIPSALFNHDVRVRNTIVLSSSSGARSCFSTRLHRWFDRERALLFPLLQYARFSPALWGGMIPKLDSQELCGWMEQLLADAPARVEDHLTRSSGASSLYFKKTAYNWLAFSAEPPPAFAGDGQAIAPSQLDAIEIADAASVPLLFLLLNGKLAFLYWCICGDDFHVTRRVIGSLPVPRSDRILDPDQLEELRGSLSAAMQQAVSFKRNAGKRVGTFHLARCREVTDRSDRLFLQAMGGDSLWEEVELFCAKAVRTAFDGPPVR